MTPRTVIPTFSHEEGFAADQLADARDRVAALDSVGGLIDRDDALALLRDRTDRLVFGRMDRENAAEQGR